MDEYPSVTDHMLGLKDIQLYYFSSKVPVLTKIIYTDVIPKYIETLRSLNMNEIIVSKHGVFTFNDVSKINGDFSCAETMFYLNQVSTDGYLDLSHYALKETESAILTKNEIISRLLNNENIFQRLNKEIKLTFNSHETAFEFDKRLTNVRKMQKSANTLKIKHERLGLQLSEVQIPLSAYDRAREFKDENELFHTAIFKTSKNPKLSTSIPIYIFE